jgi:hypothetical protein
MLRATSAAGGPAWTRTTTVARAKGVNRANLWVFVGDLTVVRKCLGNLSMQLLSPVNKLLVLYS